MLGLQGFLADKAVDDLLPRSFASAKLLYEDIKQWAEGKGPIEELRLLQAKVQVFSIVLSEELERSHTYRLRDKGNLSIDRLIEGASKGYSADIVKVLDANLIREIDEAGKCLACALNTACGFHILRSVEIAIKAYVYAMTNALPKLNKRTWGTYIQEIEATKASSDLVDLLKILKTKRNPLMHPQDNLDEPEAIDIFFICQAVMGAIIKDIVARSKSKEFEDALKIIPTL